MKLIVNGQPYITNASTLMDLKAELQIPSDVTILNGFQVSENLDIKEGDLVTLIQKGKMPSQDELESMMSVYYTHLYTDSFSLPFVTISIYLYLCAVNSKKEISKYLLLIGAGIILALGFKLKATIAIILAVIVIHLFLNQKIRTALIYTGVTIASFIVVFFLITLR